MKEIADRIRETRIARGLTQQQLAERIGLTSRSSVTKIERDTYEISLEKIKDIAAALNVDADYLIFGETETPEETMLRKYRALDSFGRDIVDHILDAEYQRCLIAGEKIG